MQYLQEKAKSKRYRESVKMTMKLHICIVLAVASILFLNVYVNGFSANRKFSNKESSGVTELHIGIKYKPKSCDVQARNGDRIQVHYNGMLTDGTIFDSSYDRAEPLKFKLGRGRVIRGWDKGLLGMCLGEKRRLKVPPQLGYGDKGHPPKIPGGATLIFDTELIAVNDKTVPDSDR